MEDIGSVLLSTFTTTVGRRDFVFTEFKNRRKKSKRRSLLLVTKFTYEAVFSGRVADLSHFIGHVVADLQVLVDELEAIVYNVLVLSVVVFLDGHRFDRVHRVEELRERHHNRFLGVGSLVRW